MARDFAYDILQSVEPYGILITAGDNDTFPLWYAQEVEGVRRDVTLANLSLMNTEWHLRQLAPARDPGLRPGRAVPICGGSCRRRPRPTTPGAEPLTQPELDSLPEAMRVPAEGGVAVRQPADPVRPGRPAAAGSRHDLPDPGQPGQAADLLQLERRRAIPTRPSG